jgi:hypothetical protein
MAGLADFTRHRFPATADEPAGPPYQTGQQQTSHWKNRKKETLTGTISTRNGHCVFQNAKNSTTLRVSNPKEVRNYRGKIVRIRGTVNEPAQTIHISSIKAVS